MANSKLDLQEAMCSLYHITRDETCKKKSGDTDSNNGGNQ
jgi:hypothetical protein